jgi:DNA-binding winged helix-turn-helix (wHTH) protein
LRIRCRPDFVARPTAASHPVRLSFEEFELDEANVRLVRNGEPLALAPTPFRVLCALARQPGALLTKDALLDSVWGHQFVSDSVLKTAISELRMALGDSPRQPRIIETVSRRGYRFIAKPTPPASPAAAAAEAAPAASSGSTTFIGRSSELARLSHAWSQACSGRRAVIWLAGEPGIGKTTLIEQFIARLGGVARARGQCVEHDGTGEPYLPVLEALAELCRNDAQLPALLRNVAPTWLLQLPWLSSAEERDALRRELAGVGPDRMLREMGELLDRYTEQRPLLLVTEDLHWSDRATIQLIDHVARRRTRANLMWLASFRVAEVVATDHPLNPLRRELRLHRLCEEIVLDPFSETEIAQYIAQRSRSLGGEEAFVRALHERTDGVPLFVSSVITEVMERTQDGADAQTRLAAVAVPENLVAIIDHYIDRLGSEQRSLLAAASVCGVEFRVETLALALQRDVTSVALGCDALAREQVWLAAPRGPAEGHAPEPYAFKHALFRQVAYDRTPPSARMQLHREVAEALERERAAGVAVAASELAMHFDRGRQPLAALRYYGEAAAAALLQFSPTACAARAERGLALIPLAPQGTQRNALELTLAALHGMAAFQSLGVGAEAKNAFQRAYALLADVPDHPMRGRLLHGFGYLSSLRGEYVDALVVAKRAEALASLSDDRLLMLVACFLHGEAHHLQGRTQAARSWMERGLVIAETLALSADQVFAADPQVTLLGMLAIDLVRCGLMRQGRALGQRAHARAAELRQPMTRLVAVWQETLLEVRVGNTERVAALVDEMQALVDASSVAHGQPACQWFRGWVEARQGRPREGHCLIREAYDHSTALGMRAGASEVLGYAAEALLLAGDAEAAQSQLQQALQLADELGEGIYLPQLHQLQAAIARAQGRPEAGAAPARRAVEAARTQEAPWLELLALVDLCAHHDANAGERQALAALVGQLPEAAGTEAVERARSLV